MEFVVRFLITWVAIILILFIPYTTYRYLTRRYKNHDYMSALYMRLYSKILKHIMTTIDYTAEVTKPSVDTKEDLIARRSVSIYLMTYAPIVASCILSAMFDIAIKLNTSPKTIIKLTFGTLDKLAEKSLNTIYTMVGGKIDVHVCSSNVDAVYSIQIPELEDWLTHPPTAEKMSSEIDRLLEYSAGKYIDVSKLTNDI